ncbi:MAG: DUF2332 domain-containing protein [Nocardioides sp.]
MDLIEAFRSQAAACSRLGSPMYDALLRRWADDLEAGGPTLAVLRGHEHDAGPSGLALRLAGTLHRLVLTGECVELGGFYPTTGGVWEPERAFPWVLGATERLREPLREGLSRAPQTNEVGRAGALIGALRLLAARHRRPVRLVEIGASGGLNLQADRFRVDLGPGAGYGPADSPVRLVDAWHGDLPELAPSVEVVERAGCDLAPVDVTTEDGRLTLTSYVWPDMTARHERLTGAIELARRDPVAVRAQGAGDFVEGLTLADETLTVLWHSVMWQYLPREEQHRVRAAVERLGGSATEGRATEGRATEGRAFAHVFMEPTRRTADAEHEFLLCLEEWPGSGERQVLATVAPHGLPVLWE